MVVITKLDGALKFKRTDGVINYYPAGSIRAIKVSDTEGQFVSVRDNGVAERFDFKEVTDDLGTSDITSYIDELYIQGYIEYSN